MSSFACATCNAPTTPTPVSFVGAPPEGVGAPVLWTVTVNVCRRPSCLERRGATAVANLRGQGAG